MKYNAAFDGLRASAVVAVVAFHCNLPGANGGFIGVDVFFVLSGFLITSLLRAELLAGGTISLARFYRNRIVRLYPPLLAMVSAWVIAAPILYPDADPSSDALVGLAYLSDYVRAFGNIEESLSHLWSLAVEEHYYMLWPFLLLATKRLKTRHLVILLAALFVCITAWRMFDLVEWRDWHATYSRFDTRMSGLTLGGLLAVLPPKNRETNSAFGILALAFLAFAVSGFRWESPFALLTGGLAVDLGAGCLILSLAAREGSVARMLSLKPLVYLGKLSYSIYLWHFPIALPLRDRFSPMLTFVIVLTAAVAIATVSYEFMEKPLAEWRHRRQQRGTVRFAQT